jgi:hypothetical protein
MFRARRKDFQPSTIFELLMRPRRCGDIGYMATYIERIKIADEMAYGFAIDPESVTFTFGDYRYRVIFMGGALHVSDQNGSCGAGMSYLMKILSGHGECLDAGRTAPIELMCQPYKALDCGDLTAEHRQSVFDQSVATANVALYVHGMYILHSSMEQNEARSAQDGSASPKAMYWIRDLADRYTRLCWDGEWLEVKTITGEQFDSKFLEAIGVP